MFQTKAMLANLNITQWSARKFDRSVTNEIDQNHNAQDGGRYNKLLINVTHLSPISQLAGRIRRYHNDVTLPWGDNGDRLLPAKSYMDYTTTLRQYRAEFEQLVDDFCQNYPQLVQERRNSLGSLYNPNDYPQTEAVRSLFSIKTTFLPIPDVADFRVDVGTQALQELQASVQQEFMVRQKAATDECWARLFDCLNRIVTTLSREKPRIFETMMDDTQSLVDMIPRLNLTDDTELNRVCQFVKDNVITPTSRLKWAHHIRMTVLREAEQALAWIPRK